MAKHSNRCACGRISYTLSLEGIPALSPSEAVMREVASCRSKHWGAKALVARLSAAKTLCTTVGSLSETNHLAVLATRSLVFQPFGEEDEAIVWMTNVCRCTTTLT